MNNSESWEGWQKDRLQRYYGREKCIRMRLSCYDTLEHRVRFYLSHHTLAMPLDEQDALRGKWLNMAIPMWEFAFAQIQLGAGR